MGLQNMYVTVERHGAAWVASINLQDWIELPVAHDRADEAIDAAKQIFHGQMIVVSCPHPGSKVA